MTRVPRRLLATLVCVCAISWAEAGCAKKRPAVAPLPPVTIAKSYPGKAAMEAMRDAIGKLRRKAPRTAGRAAPPSPDEQPVGTVGDSVAQDPQRPASSIGRDAAPSAPESQARPPGSAKSSGASDGMDPLVALIVGGWIALLVLLPLAIRYGWRG